MRRSSIVENGEVFAGVRACLASVLGTEEIALTREMPLASLGIESIDVLDVLFKIDARFGITTSMHELRTRVFGILTPAEFFDENRLVTPAGLTQLQKSIPGFDPAKAGPEFGEERLLELFTVQHLVDLVDSKLARKAAEA
jgi:acyl carrier protein